MGNSQQLSGLVIGNTSPYSGAGRALQLVAPNLKNRGIQLHFVSPDSGVSLLRGFGRVLFKEKLKHIDFVIFNALGSIIYRQSYVMSQLVRLVKIPVLVYWREMGYSFNKYNETLNKGIQFADRFAKQEHIYHFANSEACAQYIGNRYQIVPPKPVLNCAETGLPFHSNRYCTNAKPMVVNVGSIQSRKGTDLFVDTAVRVCKRHPTAEFIWIGGGHLSAECIKKIDESALQHRILFVGTMQKPGVIVRQASVFFCSSREESFSQATAEAMALARPIVTFESGGPPEILGGTGTVIPDFDTDQAAEAILNTLSEGPDKAINYAAQERYLDLYTPEKHAERLNQHIRQITGTS